MPIDLILLFKSFVSSVFEIPMFILVAYALTGKAFIFNKSFIFKTLSFIGCICISTYLDEDTAFFRILPLIIIFVFSKLILNEKMIHNIYLVILSYIILLTIQLTIAFILPFMVKNQDSFAIQIFGNSLTFVCLLLIIKFIPLHHVYDFTKKKDIPLRFFLGNTFVIIVLVNYLLNVHTNHYLYYIIPITVVVVLMIYVNIELVRSRQVVNQLQKNIDSYNKYLPIVEELIEQVRTKQHGYNNNIQSLRFLAYTCEDYDSLKTELTENISLMCVNNADITCLKFNLKLLSGILIQKQSLAAKNDINIVYNVNNFYITSKVPEYVIVELVGILLDNAIEASSSGSTIYVDIDYIDDIFTFDVSNPFSGVTPDFKRRIFKKGYSTKNKNGENQGEGLHILRSLIRYYKGTVDVSAKMIDDMDYVSFCIKI